MIKYPQLNIPPVILMVVILASSHNTTYTDVWASCAVLCVSSYVYEEMRPVHNTCEHIYIVYTNTFILLLTIPRYWKTV